MTRYIKGCSGPPSTGLPELEDIITDMSSNEYYEAMRRQRSMERRIRASKRRIAVDQEGWTWLVSACAWAVCSGWRPGTPATARSRATTSARRRTESGGQPRALRVSLVGGRSRELSGKRNLKLEKAVKRAIASDNPYFFTDCRSNRVIVHGVQKAAKSYPGYYSVALHGAPKTVALYDIGGVKSEALANIIKSREDYDDGPIALWSCLTGRADKHGRCVAQSLADILDVDVIAPTDILLMYNDGRFEVGFGNSGEMKLFRPQGGKNA